MTTSDDNRIRQLMGEIASSAHAPNEFSTETGRAEESQCPSQLSAPKRSRHRRAVLGFGFVAGAYLVGVVAMLVIRSGSETDGAADERYIAMGGSAAVPFASLVDWVSYGDAVVIITPQSEREYQPAEDEVARGEGLVPRAVTVRVDDIIWSHESAEPVPDRFEYLALPWILEKGERYRGRTEDALWPEVGQTYLASITYWGDKEGWGVVNPAALTPVEQGRVVVPDDDILPIAVLESLDGLSAQNASALLTSVRPDPAAESRRNLLPRERYAAVLEARGPADTTSPSD